MDSSTRCIDLIFASEGKKTLLPDGRYQAYLDTLAKPPVWTIWAGLTKGVHKGMCLTEDQCEAMFKKELNVYEDAIERMVTVPLNQNQFDALVSLVYNIGPGSPSDTKDKKGFYWSTLRKLLNQGKYEQAAAQFKRYKYAGGVVYKGLVTRRAKEAALFMEPMPATEDLKPIVTTTPEGESVTVPGDSIPQSVDVEKISVITAVRASPTIKAALASIAGGIASGYNWLVSGAAETGLEAEKLKTSFSGWDALWNAMGLNMGVLLAGFIVISGGYVLVRHITRYQEGRA